MKCDPGGDYGQLVGLTLLDNLQLPDLEGFGGWVDYLGNRAGVPDIADALVIGNQLRCRPDRRAVAWVQHHGLWDSPHHRDVLKCHLATAILADRDATVASNDLQVEAGDTGHADEVEGSAVEAGECVDKRNQLPGGYAHTNAHHILLSNVALDEPLRVHRVKLERTC